MLQLPIAEIVIEYNFHVFQITLILYQKRKLYNTIFVNVFLNDAQNLAKTGMGY